MKLKKTLTSLALGIVGITMLSTTQVQAALQGIPTTSNTKTDTATNWIINVRKMEEENGGMGLREKVGSDALATTEANDIDVHLLKNTEYGAIVLLGASDYGKQGAVGGSGQDRWMTIGGTATSGTAKNLATTTGNVTGIYEIGYRDMKQESGNYEWVAGGASSFLSNIASRYIDRYSYYDTKDSSYANVKDKADTKAGDATIETAFWHSTGAGFYWLGGAGRGFIRGNSGLTYGAFFRTATTVLLAPAMLVPVWSVVPDFK